ncbi:MAG TPA: hypothetical protein VMT38_10915 [Terracidiphilus sp.]|nr:hypothetical protein [Terracidiphilus sp.]
MLARIGIFVVFLAQLPGIAQVAPGATGGTNLGGDTEMQTPPPASGDRYSTEIGSEKQSNYFLAGVTANTAYVSNLFPSQTSAPVSDTTISILPNFQLTRSTPRQQDSITYSPSFVFYEPTTVLDSINQAASTDFRYRLSPAWSIGLQDAFYRTSNVFDQSSTYTAVSVSGSTENPIATVIAPFAEQLTNTARADLSYQFGRDGMIGAGGIYSITNFPGLSPSAGISNSKGIGVNAFYNRRLARTQYLGVTYQFTRTVASVSSQQATTTTQSMLPFYSYYFKPTISLSVSGGVERVDVILPQAATFSSWSPSGVVSLGWQTERFNVAASYTRVVTSGQGLFGAFNASGVGATGGWKLARTWDVALSATYITSSNLTPQLSLYSGGTTISGQASVHHDFGERFAMDFGYDRLHQNYPGVTIVTESPDCNQEYVDVRYEFRKPLGR